MAAAPTYDHLATYDIHVRGRKRYEADPRSFVEAGRAWSRIVFERCGAGVFPDEDRYRMLGLFSRLPAWCDPPTGVPPSPRLLDDMGTPPAAGPELPKTKRTPFPKRNVMRQSSETSNTLKRRSGPGCLSGTAIVIW